MRAGQITDLVNIEKLRPLLEQFLVVYFDNTAPIE